MSEEKPWIKCSDKQPEIGDEYQVVWNLDDNHYTTVTSMDWDAKEQIWTDPRGVEGKSMNESVLYWKELAEPPKDIPKAIWHDELIDDKVVYGHCMHGENMANCEICNSYK